MNRDKYPSENAERFQVRLPDGLRDEIRDTAAANNRSMNAEIVARLSGQQRTLRDWFAGQALAGFMSAKPMHFHPEQDAKYFYALADAMVATREPQP